MVQVNVQGGGPPTGSSSDIQNHFQSQNYTSVQLAKNFHSYGRPPSTSDDDTTTAGTNGTFIYNCLVITLCLRVPRRHQDNQASQFSITPVLHPVSTTMWDMASMRRMTGRLARSLGQLRHRYETQNHLTDHSDIAPRIS